MIQPMDHTEAIRKLRKLLDRLHERADATGLAVAVRYQDGSTASLYESEDHAGLLGALAALEARIIREGEL